MDLSGYGSLLQGASSVIKATQPSTPTAPSERADGYSLGGTDTGTSSGGAVGGATGGAYGGAWSQANVDGSNWTVSTGRARAVGGGTSGGNGGVAPVQTGTTGGVSPSSPFTFGTASPAASLVSGIDPMLLIALGVIAVLVLRR